MSENELNSYRFLSGEDPTDEMLEAIMSEARDAAVKKAEITSSTGIEDVR